MAQLASPAMEILIVVIVVVLVLALLALAGGGVALARRNRTVELEPPAAPGLDSPDPAVTTPASPIDDGGVVPDEGTTITPDELVPDAPIAVPAEEIEAPSPPVEVAPRPSFKERLGRARSVFSDYVTGILARSSIEDETWDDLEEAMLRADVGVGPTTELLDGLRARVAAKELTETSELLDALKQDMKALLAMGDRSLHFEQGVTNVWLFVGVNGVGKTTTIGKVGHREKQDNGRSVLMAAGDTFRAAAAEQLAMWADRSDAEFVRGNEGGDPSSVIFDGVKHAAAQGIDLVLADTAGRLHTKSNLMEELGKVRRVADRDPGQVQEVLLVLDATTGQNGLVQAQQFTDAVELTGVVLTKLDGSAKGGIVLAIQSELDIPVKLVGLGEGLSDLVEFDEEQFVEALFSS